MMLVPMIGGHDVEDKVVTPGDTCSLRCSSIHCRNIDDRRHIHEGPYTRGNDFHSCRCTRRHSSFCRYCTLGVTIVPDIDYCHWCIFHYGCSNVCCRNRRRYRKERSGRPKGTCCPKVRTRHLGILHTQANIVAPRICLSG